MSPHVPLLLRQPSITELQSLEGSWRPKTQAVGQARWPCLSRADTLGRVGVAELETLALWRRRAVPASRGVAAGHVGLEVARVDAEFFGGSDEGQGSCDEHF